MDMFKELLELDNQINNRRDIPGTQYAYIGTTSVAQNLPTLEICVDFYHDNRAWDEDIARRILLKHIQKLTKQRIVLIDSLYELNKLDKHRSKGTYKIRIEEEKWRAS